MARNILPRPAATIERSVRQIFQPNKDLTLNPDQSDPFQRILLGKQPIETYQKRQAGNKAKLGAPLAFLGTALNIGGDVTGFSGTGKTAGKDVVEQLAKASTTSEVKKLLAKKYAPDVVEKIAPHIAQATDKNVIKNIINDGLSPAPLKAAANTPPPITPVMSDILPQGRQVVQNTNKSLVDATIPKVPPTTATDPFDEILGAVHGTPGNKGIAQKSAEQAKLLSKERGARFTASGEASKTAEGSHGYFAEKKALGGDYSKVEFSPLVHDIGPDRAEELFTGARQKILQTPDKVYEDMGLHPGGARLNTQTAVRKVLGLEPGLPTKSELKLLGVLSPKLAEEAKAVRPIGRKIMDAASTLFGTARAAKSTLDLSFGGRQGIFVAARHPIEWAKANIESVKYAKNGQYYKDSMKAVHGDEWGQLIDKYKPSLLTGGASHEEAYAGGDILSGKIAKDKLKVGNLVAGAERAYTGGLTTLRKNLLVKNLKAYGSTAEEAEKTLGKKGLGGLLESVGVLTGRGGKAGGFVEKHATTLQEALFSPRLWASRLAPLNPAFWARIGPAGRKEAMQSLGAFAAVAGTVLGAAAMAGADVEKDPRSSDFLKIKVGDTRYDILGGFQQNLVFGARQLAGSTKSSQSGKITEFGANPLSPTRLSAAFDLVRNKANPVLGSAANILEGKDKAGNKINPATEIGQLFVPISIQGSYQAFKQNGLKGVAKNSPDFVGISTQSYGIKDIKPSTSQQTYLDTLKSKGVPKAQIDASKSFFQTLKTGPDRTSYGSQIKKALESGDTNKAVSLAKEYNTKYSSTFKDWSKQYSQYRGDENLVKEFNSNLITDDTIGRYIADIKKKQAGGL